MKTKNTLRRVGFLVGVVFTPVLLVAAVLLVYQAQADASSHREAPMISQDAFADNTDVYAFVSPNNENNVVLISNWIPFEGPEGGPNYFEWDDNVQYNIHIDNDGDARSDITYTLRSKVQVATPQTFLYNTATIQPDSDFSNWNRRQYITVTETTEDGGHTVLVDGKLTAPVNIGSKSTPNYEHLEDQAIYTYSFPEGEAMIFGGQADDPFWVDLQVFDLLTLRGQNAPIGYSQGNNIPVDSVSGFNVHSLVLELPTDHLTQGSEPVIGVWATSRRQSQRVLGPAGQRIVDGPFVQISRLGMPLTNEAVLPMGLKDVFNGITPADDLPAYGLLQEYVENPELGRLLCGLYGVPLPEVGDTPCNTEFITGTARTGRGDIFDIFLTGMVLTDSFTIVTKSGQQTLPAGTNVNQSTSVVPVVPAEMLRLNTALKGDMCAPTPHRLGLLTGDACGFPNGRRLTDDVVEIELLAVAGAAYKVLDGEDTGFAFDLGLVDLLDDGVDNNDVPFRSDFPYLALAQSGQEHIHQNPVMKIVLPLILKSAYSLQVVPTKAQEHPVSTVMVTALLGLPAAIFLRRRRQ